MRMLKKELTHLDSATQLREEGYYLDGGKCYCLNLFFCLRLLRLRRWLIVYAHIEIFILALWLHFHFLYYR